MQRLLHYSFYLSLDSTIRAMLPIVISLAQLVKSSNAIDSNFYCGKDMNNLKTIDNPCV